MKVIVAGSRDIKDEQLVGSVLDTNPFISMYSGLFELVSGMAPGVDLIAYRLCKEPPEGYQWSYRIPVHEFPAEWDRFGHAAGHIRNSQMANFADALIAIWDGESAGTKNMIDQMFRRKKDVYVVFPD